MSGDFALVGEQVQRSIALALQEVDNPEHYEFMFEDGQCDKRLSLSAARKLIDIDKVQIIIAAGCSDTTLAIAPIVNEEKIVVLMPSTGGKNIDEAGEYIFRNGNSDIVSATKPAHDFISLFNYTSVALITDQTAAMEDIRTHFIAEYESLGGEVLLDETVDQATNDFRTIIEKIEQKRPNVIFINSQKGTSGAYFIDQYSLVGGTIPIVTNFNTATNTQTHKLVGEDIEGVYFYDPDYNQDSIAVQSFLNKYEYRYGDQPPLKFHAIATRDAVHMTIQAIEATGNDGELMQTWLLTNIQNWEGLMGSISFDEEGNSEAGYVLKQFVDGEAVLV